MKKILPIIGIVLFLGIGAYVLQNRTGSSSLVSPLRKEISLGTDVCAEFPKEWVSQTIGVEITKTESINSTGTHICQYYDSGTDFISIKYENLNAENIKKGQEILERTIQTDPRIEQEHFIAVQDDGLINSIYLVINPNMLVAIDRSSAKILMDNESDIIFASKVATRLKNTGNVTESTPTESETQLTDKANQQQIVSSFFDMISKKNIPDAITMMSPKTVGDESQKQAWGVQFAAFDILKINLIAPSMPEEWTDTIQSYKVTMDVKMSENSAQAPIPYYGYENGINTRWIQLEKIGNNWKIQGIATGP